mmetsp:Transcript_17612/g.16843  ORF Transcript_17612/g.16843 Transcript_17612/m.16843 type:complete len:84 (-) Transcript_17612:857-1108(-)
MRRGPFLLAIFTELLECVKGCNLHLVVLRGIYQLHKFVRELIVVILSEEGVRIDLLHGVNEFLLFLVQEIRFVLELFYPRDPI